MASSKSDYVEATDHDRGLLDAYSQAVMSVVDTVGPSVVRLLTEEWIGDLTRLKILRRGELRRVLVTPREVQ